MNRRDIDVGPGRLIAYGHWGRPLLVFPSEQGAPWDYESNGMIDALAWLIDAGRREVHVDGTEIQLAPKEFDLLWELLDHRGLVLTRDQLLERVWGYTFAGDTRTVDVHVRQLRRKLGEASPIVTVWGVGYKVAPARDAAVSA